jgi:hypothetical protein
MEITTMKCGPENCPLTAWSALSPTERKLQRQPLARKLQEQGFTPEQIADQFGVQIRTIYRDLEFCHDVKTQPRISKRGRKGEGRPKGTAPKPKFISETSAPVAEPSPSLALKQRKPSLERLTPDQHRIHKLEARIRELEALVLPLDDEGKDAVRQYKRKLDREFKIRWQLHDKVIRERNVIIDEKAYTTMLAGMHPDASKAIRDRARTVLEGLRKRVLLRKDEGTWP